MTEQCLSQRRILLMGGAGFIGRHAIHALVSVGAQVYATCSRDELPPTEPACTWLPIDFDHRMLPRDVDSVVYLSDADRWRNTIEDAPEVCGNYLKSLFRAAECARAIGAERFIYMMSVSADSVIQERERGILEITNPRDVHAASMLAAEVLLRTLQPSLAVIVLRLFWPYGDSQDTAMPVARLVQAVRQGRPIALAGSEGPLCNPVAVQDVVTVLKGSLDLLTSGALDVAGPEVLTLRQVAEQIGRVLGIRPKYKVIPEQGASIVGDTAPLREALGWGPSTTMDEGLRSWLLDPTGADNQDVANLATL